MKIDAERLRGFLDCMHAEADEREKHSAQIRSIVKAAKDVGYDTKAIRKVFARERMDEAARAEQDNLLETYEHALGGKGRALVAIASGVPVGEACEANGVHRATVARARHVAKQISNATPHDPETGEIEERSDRQSAPCGGEASAACNPASASSSPPHPEMPPEQGAAGIAKPPAGQAAPPPVDWDELARVKRDLDAAYRAKRAREVA